MATTLADNSMVASPSPSTTSPFMFGTSNVPPAPSAGGIAGSLAQPDTAVAPSPTVVTSGPAKDQINGAKTTLNNATTAMANQSTAKNSPPPPTTPAPTDTSGITKALGEVK